MKFTHLYPNIFYADIQLGLRLFVDYLEFKFVGYEIKSTNLFFAF